MYLKEYASSHDARRSLTAYLDFYNYQRLHQARDYQTPAVVYHGQPTLAADTLTVPVGAGRLG